MTAILKANATDYQQDMTNETIEAKTHVRYHFVPRDFQIQPDSNVVCLEECYYDTSNFDFVTCRCWISSRYNYFTGKEAWRLKIDTTTINQDAHVKYQEISFSDKNDMLQFLYTSTTIPKLLRDKTICINFSAPFCAMNVDRYYISDSHDIWVDVCCWADGEKEKHYVVGTQDMSSHHESIKVPYDVAPSKALLFLGLTQPTALASYPDVERNLAQRYDLVKDHFQTSMIVGRNSSHEVMPSLGFGDSDYECDSP